MQLKLSFLLLTISVFLLAFYFSVRQSLAIFMFVTGWVLWLDDRTDHKTE
jgi:hypothetical protein